MKKYQSKERDLHIVFIDSKKAYDKVSREILMVGIGKKKWVCVAYIQVINDMYDGTIQVWGLKKE